MKMIDVVDENNVMLNEQLEYKTALAENRWYREVAIIIMSNTERLLLLKETSPKESNLWTIKTNYGEAGEGPIFAAIRVAKKVNDPNKNVVVLFPDGGDRYLSTSLFEE